MRRHLDLKVKWVVVLLCGLIAGCGRDQTSGDDSTIVRGNEAAHNAWEKAKADGSLKNRVIKQAPDMQNQRHR